MTSSFTDYADFAAQCDAANAYADAQQVIARTPITLAAPVTAEERSMLLGQLRLGKTGTQILNILDVITADYAQPLKYNDTVVPDCFVQAPSTETIEF